MYKRQRGGRARVGIEDEALQPGLAAQYVGVGEERHERQVLADDLLHLGINRLALLDVEAAAALLEKFVYLRVGVCLLYTSPSPRD